MRAKFVAVLPWMLLIVAIVAWGMALWFDRGSDEVTGLLDKLWALSFFAFPIVGVFLARRIPANAVGWLFIVGPLLVGAGVAFQEIAETLAIPGLVTPSEIVFDAGLLALFSSLTLFPDGRYSRSWWPSAHAAAIIVFSVVAGSFIAVILVLGLLPLVYRLIKGSPLVRRQIAGPILVLVLGVVSLILVSVTFGDTALAQTLITLITMVITIGVPVSIAIAITRYRLYEIDRLISRTVSYLLVVGLLAAVFIGVVTAAGSLLQTDSDLAIAASTLAVAALFNPMRKRVQTWVDRRFNRSRYDAQKVMDGFSGSLRDQVDPVRVIEGWVGVVSQTMQPAAAGVWVRER
jgi:Polysaccharide biosynthesis protein